MKGGFFYVKKAWIDMRRDDIKEKAGVSRLSCTLRRSGAAHENALL
jgi:hypothetical protein